MHPQGSQTLQTPSPLAQIFSPWVGAPASNPVENTLGCFEPGRGKGYLFKMVEILR